MSLFSSAREGDQLRHALAGAADFLVEIISPGERTREKIPFTAASAWWNC